MNAACLPSAISGAAPLPHPFRGSFETLPFVSTRFELVGTPRQGTIGVLGGISAGRHVTANRSDESAGWWQSQCGHGCALDTADYAVLSFEFLGAELTPGAPVPRIDTSDQARALAAVLDHLGIERLTALVGSSYGGMVALAFAALFPQRVERLLVIGAAHEPHPMATALRSIQREVVRMAHRLGAAAEGLDLARRLAMTTYRTAEEFAERFTADQRVQDYLAHCGRSYAQRFTAERFLCLSQSIDSHRVDPATITVPTTLVAIEGDAIAPPWQVQRLAAQLGEHATVIQIRSRYGHDAFLKETAAIARILERTLAPEVHA